MLRYLALAVDFDGTSARDGVVEAPTIEALARVRQHGRRLILVTGRQLDDLISCVPRLDLFDRVVAEDGAVMVLPPSINKATGLAAALAEIELSPHNVVAVGDAENDHAMLHLAECAVAVANALPIVKAHADLVTLGDHGAGVREVIDQLLAGDLAAIAPRLQRHDVLVGRGGAINGREPGVDPSGD